MSDSVKVERRVSREGLAAALSQHGADDGDACGPACVDGIFDALPAAAPDIALAEAGRAFEQAAHWWITGSINAGGWMAAQRAFREALGFEPDPRDLEPPTPPSGGSGA